MPKGEATLKFVGGRAEIRDAEGRIVEPITEYRGSHYVRLENRSGKNEIWSVRMPKEVPSFLVIKFFAPFNGLFSDDPERLGTTEANLRFCRVTPELIERQSSAAAVMHEENLFEGRAGVDLPRAFDEVVDKAVKARTAFAAEKKWQKLAAEEAKRLETFRAKASGEIAQKEVQDLENGLKAIEAVAAIEKAIDAENEGQKRIAAFAQEFLLLAPIGAPSQVTMFLEWKLSGKSLDEYPQLAKMFKTPSFKRSVIDALSRFGLTLVNDESIAYEKFADIARFAEEIAKGKIR